MAKWPNYSKGDWSATCDSCGFSFPASQLRKRWDGLMVCSKDWEQRHPQDFVRARQDVQAVPWTRPEAADTFIRDSEIVTNTSIAMYAIAGRMVAGVTTIPDTVPPSSFTP